MNEVAEKTASDFNARVGGRNRKAEWGITVRKVNKTIKIKAESVSMLTDIQVVEIYERKIALLSRSMSLQPGDSVSSSLPVRGKSKSVAKLYGVSSRTIRDIWNRQTWGVTTSYLWDREVAHGFDGSKQDNGKVQNKFDLIILLIHSQLDFVELK